MKITFLGTGAADFSPLLKTEFLHRLDRDQRRSSSLLLENRFLVDCGPHVLNSMEIQSIDATKITDLFLTHLHDDHCDWDNIRVLAKTVKHPLRIWYRAGAEIPHVENVQFFPLEPLQSVKVDHLHVKALAANHTCWPLHYDFQIGDVKLFYGCDGAWLLNDTFLEMMKRNYNCMIMDGTVGDYNGDFRLGEHNSIPMLRLMAASFQTQQVLASDGQIWLSHLARTLHKSHAETAEMLKKDNFFVAYDGLTLLIT